jgi:small neutral amino acid transporter SnatA (MarC family)
MNEIWIAQQDEDIKLRLAQLEGHAESAINESIEHKDVALASSYITALMAAVVGAGEYATQKWGVRQDIESIIGGITLCFTVLEVSLMRANKKQAAEAWQTAAHFFIEEDSAE